MEKLIAKRGLVEYILRHTSNAAVEATPNVANLASVKIQEAAGGARVGEGCLMFPISGAITPSLFPTLSIASFAQTGHTFR